MNGNSSTACAINYPDISPATSYVFGTAFTLCGIMTVVGNTISLIILRKPTMRTKSNKFLTSLAVSDLLVGLILCPVAAVQLFAMLLTNCYLELARVFLSIALCGVSAATVALIAYDRYVLLSSLNNYNIKMTSKKVFLLISLSWFLPTIFQTFYAINSFLYLLSLCVLTIGPFIILTVSYVMMAKKIREKEKELAQHSKYLQNKNTAKHEYKKEKKNLKLARKLTLLIVCYILCLFPALVNFLAEISIRIQNVDKPVGLQILTVFSLVCASVNSVINPLIYVSKYPEFKREFRKLFGLKNKMGDNESSMISMSHASTAQR